MSEPFYPTDRILLNEAVRKIDPRSKNLTQEELKLLYTEMQKNPAYYFFYVNKMGL